jgi:quinol monooxygenase YgiN
MSNLIVHHRVKDFAAWKPVFDQHASMRGAAGCKGGYLLRSPVDPNDVTIFFQWDSADHAKKFAQSDDLRTAMQKAGVLGKPDVQILDQVGQFAN